MSWIRADVDGPLGLEQAIARHREREVALDPFMAATDLRWWQHRILAPDSRVELPSGRDLAIRWGWKTEKRVRLLLQREEEWSDPRLLKQWRAYRGRTEDARRTQLGRDSDAIDDGGTPPSTDSGRNSDADESQDGPKKGDTRGVDHGDDHDHGDDRIGEDVGPAPPALEEEPSADDQPTVFDRHSLAFLQAATYFGEVVHRNAGKRPSKGPERSSKLGKKLYDAVKKDPELVLDAMRFAGECQIERAVKLREYAGLTVATILAHVDEYAELWREYGDRHQPMARAPPDGRPRTGHAGDGVLEEMWRERNPPREVYDGE